MRINYDFNIVYKSDTVKLDTILPDIIKDINAYNSRPNFLNGGFEGFQKYIYENRYYDVFNIGYEEMMAMPKQRIVKLSFDIDTKGKIHNIMVLQGVHPIYDKEAVHLIRNLPQWSPGIVENRNVNSRIFYGIHFHRDKKYN